MSHALLLPLLLALLWCGEAALANPEAAVSVKVTVLGGRADDLSRELESATPALLKEIEAQIGLPYDDTVSLVLCLTREGFDSYISRFGDGVLNEAVGVAYWPTRSIALNMALIHETGTTARSVYKHELCHLVLARHIAPHLRPLWFEEGVAQWVSETPFDAAMSARGFASGLGPDPTSLDHVTAMFRDPAYTADAYRHALAAVSSMARRFKPAGMIALLQALSAASNADRPVAFAEVFGAALDTSFGQFEQEFVASRQRGGFARVVLFIGNYAWPLAGVTAALLLLLAVARKRRREAGMLQNWREQDEIFPPDPSWAAAEEAEKHIDDIVAESLADALNDPEDDEGFDEDSRTDRR